MARFVRKRYLPLIAAAGAATAVLPSIASSSGASVVASDYRWSANGTSPAQVAVMPNGSVAFSYPSGMNQHYPKFDVAGNPPPPSCDAGVPTSPAGPGWSGNCTFSQAGVYQFYCGVHPSMTGTVYVNAAGTVPATTPTTPMTTTTTTTPPPGGSGGSGGGPGTTTPAGGGGGPGAGSAIAQGSLKLPAVQRGSAVKGSLVVGAGGAQLTIGLSLPATQARARTISAGKLSRRAAAGPLSFTVPLNRAGRRALSRHHRLRLSVRIHAAPQGAGTASDLVRRVSLSD